jgi:hypothetical protein
MRVSGECQLFDASVNNEESFNPYFYYMHSYLSNLLQIFTFLEFPWKYRSENYAANFCHIIDTRVSLGFKLEFYLCKIFFEKSNSPALDVIILSRINSKESTNYMCKTG